MSDRVLGRTRRGFGRLARAEEGTVSILTMFVVVIMLTAAGLAIDSMRHERQRVRLQATLDNAVLAATDLDQALDPAAVVQDYFDTAGLSSALVGDPVVVDRRNFRSVSMEASFDLPTVLLGLAGVDTLPVPTAARAEEGANIEVSLVLDVSGSMWGSKLTNLKAAAKEFAEMMLPATAPTLSEGATTVSLVPYSMSVNIGSEMFAHYNVVPNGTFGVLDAQTNCMLLTEEDFASASFPPSRARLQQYLFDDDDGAGATGFRGYVGDQWPGRISTPHCEYGSDPATDRHVLLPMAIDAPTLTTAIDRIGPYDATGIGAGMRWGITMLDPDTRPIVSSMIGTGSISAVATGRPFDYDEPQVKKVVILMTDGEPDAPRDMHDELKDQWSNVYFDEITGRYSVLLRGSYLADFPYDLTESDRPGEQAGQGPGNSACHANWPDAARPATVDGIVRPVSGSSVNDDCAPVWYWIDHDPADIVGRSTSGGGGSFHDHPHTRHADATETDPRRHDWPDFETELRRLSYAEVYRQFTQDDSGKVLYKEPRAKGWITNAERGLLIDSWGGTFDMISLDDTVDRLVRLCGAAKDEGVVIYTIAFELDESKDLGRRLMSDCATSAENHFFDVESLEISETFRTIASGIGQLRLTR